MINKIKMQNVASYKESAELIADKKIMLMYGLNGTGKSTFSNYLYDIENMRYKDCSVEGLEDDNEILVYNQKFVNENFHEANTLKGIFTLSKENKKAKQIIEKANLELQDIEKTLSKRNSEFEEEQKKFDKQKKTTEDKLWEVKTKYTGGDRVLEYCLEGLKGTKSKLFDYIINLEEQKQKPIKDIDEIKNEIKILGNAENKLTYLELINPNVDTIEHNEIFNKVIVGNNNSTVAQMINQLGNSDWVKSGLVYINTDNKESHTCPFCQSETITEDLLKNIKDFFDESYERDVQQVYTYKDNYNIELNRIANISLESNDVIPKESVLEFNVKYQELLSLMEENVQLIDNKIKMPSKVINLKYTNEKIEEVNRSIKDINKKIKNYNDKIDNKAVTLKELKDEFWKNIRWEYNIVIKNYIKEKSEIKDKYSNYINNVTRLKAQLDKTKITIMNEQKKTVNIDEAIININNGLLEIGIGEFSIVKADKEESMYKIARGDEEEDIFKSLSEGEKMLISFLYFIELCRGKQEAAEVEKKKIIVIDDPITSMSHVYIFNIGRMIHNEFLRDNKYEQVFILTHSLYFFYELTCMKKNDRDELQKLVRICKDANGSKFVSMHYHEIENDYQAYWSIIKDSEQQPALIANCMRNIIEYFFGFVEKKELSNVFQIKSLQQNKFRAFYRYINRESHSIGQNIFDFKEFNYEDFKEAFALVFKETGYEAHYKKMMR